MENEQTVFKLSQSEDAVEAYLKQLAVQAAKNLPDECQIYECEDSFVTITNVPGEDVFVRDISKRSRLILSKDGGLHLERTEEIADYYPTNFCQFRVLSSEPAGYRDLVRPDHAFTSYDDVKTIGKVQEDTHRYHVLWDKVRDSPPGITVAQRLVSLRDNPRQSTNKVRRDSASSPKVESRRQLESPTHAQVGRHGSTYLVGANRLEIALMWVVGCVFYWAPFASLSFLEPHIFAALLIGAPLSAVFPLFAFRRRENSKDVSGALFFDSFFAVGWVLPFIAWAEVAEFNRWWPDSWDGMDWSISCWILLSMLAIAIFVFRFVFDDENRWVKRAFVRTWAVLTATSLLFLIPAAIEMKDAVELLNREFGIELADLDCEEASVFLDRATGDAQIEAADRILRWCPE